MAKEPLTDDGAIRKSINDTYSTYNVKHSWKQGFPLDTPHDQAIQEALVTARSSGGITAELISSEIVITPEHEANGELLVALLFGELTQS